MRFSIIVGCPVFSPRLGGCLEAIFRFTRPVPGGIELVIVHDGSRAALEFEDTHQKAAFGTFKDTHLLKTESRAENEDSHLLGQEQNVRFVSAAPSRNPGVVRNIGAAEAVGEFLVFLDSDVLVTHGWLEALSAPMEEKKVGVVGAKVVELETNLVSHAGLVFNSALKGFYPIYQHFDPRFHGVNKQREFPAVLGCCLLVRSELFNSAGGFTSCECEDVDFCLKAKEAGSTVVFTPYCSVQHKGNLSRSHISTAQDSFRKRWLLDQMPSNDEHYYYEDGMRVHIDERAQISYKEVVSESCEYVGKALRLCAVGKKEEAEELLLRALVVYPGNADAYLELAELSERDGLLEKALSYCDKLLSLQPRVLRAGLIKARVLIKQNQKAIAVDILKELWESSDTEESIKKEARELLRSMAIEAH